ncbi:MAG: GNAT family N-acetyltransferase [Firmicutes bacterium]|nr:GNAT family N-acetyltransferase [Bacillota bacterium]
MIKGLLPAIERGGVGVQEAGMLFIRIEEVDKVEPDLLQALIEIDQEAFGKGGMNEWFLPPFIRRGRVYVLWVEGKKQPVGVAECMITWGQPQCAYLFGIAIREGWRGQGLGTRFLREICRRLQGMGFLILDLTVSPDNVPALRVYRDKLGFKTIAFHREEYGQGEDRLLMRLDLTQQVSVSGEERQYQEGGGQ